MSPPDESTTMTATLTRTRIPGRPASDRAGTAPAATARRGGRINRSRAAAGMLLTFLSVATVTTLYARADDRITVVAVQARVPAGQPVTADDLTVVEVPADTALATVAADRAPELIGQVALSTLEPGMLLAPSLVAAQPLVPTGSAVVGATLKPGQYPVGLRVGDKVRLVETPASSATQATPAVTRGLAQVVDLSELPGGTGVAVSLLVPDGSSVVLSSAGAAGRLSLAVVAS